MTAEEVLEKAWKQVSDDAYTDKLLRHVVDAARWQALEEAMNICFDREGETPPLLDAARNAARAKCLGEKS